MESLSEAGEGESHDVLASHMHAVQYGYKGFGVTTQHTPILCAQSAVACMDGVLDAIHLDDVRAGTGKWRNIQDSVRYAVAALCTTASAQARAITTLEAKLEALCSHFASHAGRSEEIFSQHHSRIAVSEETLHCQTFSLPSTAVVESLCEARTVASSRFILVFLFCRVWRRRWGA